MDCGLGDLLSLFLVEGRGNHLVCKSCLLGSPRSEANTAGMGPGVTSNPLYHMFPVIVRGTTGVSGGVASSDSSASNSEGGLERHTVTRP